jgi:hypothetical protein
VPILAVGAEDRAALAVALLKAGASDYAVAGTEDVATCARGLLESASPRPPGDVAIPGLVGTSRAMVEVRALVDDRSPRGSRAAVRCDPGYRLP